MPKCTCTCMCCFRSASRQKCWARFVPLFVAGDSSGVLCSDVWTIGLWFFKMQSRDREIDACIATGIWQMNCSINQIIARGYILILHVDLNSLTGHLGAQKHGSKSSRRFQYFVRAMNPYRVRRLCGCCGVLVVGVDLSCSHSYLRL